MQIADDLRIKIEAGELQPGDSLPTLHELAEQWSCSITSARTAIQLMKQQGLITGGRGKAPTVRIPPRQVVRTSKRHQEEKDLVLTTERERSHRGLAEEDMHVPLDALKFHAEYRTVEAGDLAEAFGIDPSASLLERVYEHSDPRTGRLEAWSISWIPSELIRDNPAISDPANAAWPGGTLHQLYTVGIEVIEVIDDVTAAMPSTVDIERWELPDGIPMIWCRRTSIDTKGRTVEVTDAQYPADRTRLTFHTPLTPWSEEQ
ncbi:GntR family transcriptional regulator [Saccharomonospora iraqiensis]|uniref:GntR family transcriptional regulator n=1 Tax=Saccharomonospora iraqiensis TaxID=52698 RepID=UPI00040E3690|nr:GntR family transcriptional regulator [Saccharomonospora iraqiensis]